MVKAINLGSNVGHRRQCIARAIILLAEHVEITARSGLYETPALLPENAPPEWDSSFVNQCVLIETDITPQTCLQLLNQIEREVGRPETYPKWSPRVLDMDIVCWDDQVIEEEHLQIPHAGLLSRNFFLLPLAELAPDWPYPVPGKQHGNSVATLCTLVEQESITKL